MDILGSQLLSNDIWFFFIYRYKIVTSFSGTWLPFSQGFTPFIHSLSLNESRMNVEKWDRVNVTRAQQYWLYGTKIIKSKHSKWRRIWFRERERREVVIIARAISPSNNISHHIKSSMHSNIVHSSPLLWTTTNNLRLYTIEHYHNTGWKYISKVRNKLWFY